jgi:hypothetical protein
MVATYDDWQKRNRQGEQRCQGGFRLRLAAGQVGGEELGISYMAYPKAL